MADSQVELEFDDEEEDGHELVFVIRINVPAKDNHTKVFSETLTKLEEAVPEDAEIAHTIDMTPVDEEGDDLF